MIPLDLNLEPGGWFVILLLFTWVVLAPILVNGIINACRSTPARRGGE